ncbi:cytochrome P450 [Nitrospirillum sp. BR 11164]|uniref:cytochrome P450 n=1 Tax=Nitrospirillum sp. BR 11164 TaxID=3104324 RepID=UPI002AFEB88F|nr:cytochrome P450 [Nitrospirillum sp. BR 11164]MEA1652826.1 cytochrome P450 [Nitrospirillum sp. BR 11164]
MADLASFNSLAPILRDDPYPVYATLREQAPIFWTDAEQAWVVLGRREVCEAFANSNLLTLDLGQYVGDVSRALGDEPVELLRLLDMVLFFRNPPSHGPLRSLVARLLAFRSQASCAAAVAGIADRLIAPLARDGGIDLMGDYADPLPPLFMGWLFGLADDEARWLAVTLAGVPVILNRGCSIRDYRAANISLEKAHAFLRDRIAERRREPADDGLSLLVGLNGDAERPLDDDRLAALASFVFMAGFETTAALIGNGLWLLLSHPEQYDRVAAHSDLIPGAVDEALRLEPPIQQVRRRAKGELMIADRTIKAGQHIILMIAAANRDPGVYPDPDRFLPGRAGQPVLSLGGGLHHCLGGWVARMEAAIALGAVLKGPRPSVGLEKPEWRPHHNQRRMRSLPVRL